MLLVSEDFATLSFDLSCDTVGKGSHEWESF